MKFDFDKVIDRRNTHSTKWDAMEARTGVNAPDAIAMWVADMDFEAPPAVKEALMEEVNRSVHGYYANDITWREAMSGWLNRRHGYEPDPEWITPTAGVCSALGLIIQAYSDPGDAVVVFSPVYHAFFTYINANDRQPFSHELEQVDGQYRMDFERLEKTLPKNAKIVFFCSPHNPGGRVWSEGEIRELCDFCIKHDLILISDEIHHDLVFPEAKHSITHMVAPYIEDRLITCVGATKTFNLAGSHVCGAIISNEKLRKKFKKVAARSGLLSHSLFGMLATEAAQRYGDEWLDQLLPYLQENRDILATRVEKAVPHTKAMHLQSTYLAWVDFEGAGLAGEHYMRTISEDARIGASAGPLFGKGGESFVRFNFATPRPVLLEAMDRMDEAFKDWK